MHKPLCAFVLATSTIFAQAPASASNAAFISEARTGYESIKNNLLKTAAKVPESDYTFKPTPDIRSFAEVLQHVVMSQSRVCGSMIEKDASPSDASGNKSATKSDIDGALKRSFDTCDKAFDALSETNAGEMVQSPRGERTRLGALAALTTHDVEQYAILTVYMRLKGIIPPSSENSGNRPGVK